MSAPDWVFSELPDDEDEEEPCRCCDGPGFGQGEHVHDDATCEHTCCPGWDVEDDPDARMSGEGGS